MIKGQQLDGSDTDDENINPNMPKAGLLILPRFQKKKKII